MIDVVHRAALSPFKATLFSAAFSVAFFGALRISELVARSKKDGSGNAIGRQDTLLTGVSLRIQVKSSKTDQLGLGKVIWLHPLGDNRYCPVGLVSVT